LVVVFALRRRSALSERPTFVAFVESPARVAADVALVRAGIDQLALTDPRLLLLAPRLEVEALRER
jgi:hypothetical protein